jgi:hypothetical protein
MLPMLPALAACGAGQVVTIGSREPQPYHFDTPRVVAELAAPADRTDNPTLTGDLLEIYFTSDRGGTGDLWFAKRTSVAGPFGPPEPIANLNTGGFETSAAISTDGLTLWFGSDRSGGVGLIDIWASTRATRTSAWTAPLNLVALNSAADDIPRPPGLRDTVMPMASTRAVVNLYQTYFAARAGRGAPFGAPVAIPRPAYADRSTVDAFLSDDGLTMFFSSAGVSTTDGGVGSTSDLFVAFRRSTGEAFDNTQPLDDLNTAADERDPWLTPDGKTLYFTSDRDGPLVIYTAAVRPRE